MTNGESSKYENMAKPLLREPEPQGPPTGGDKIMNGVGNVVFGTVGAIGSGVYVIGTDGVGAALGGGTAFAMSLGEVAIGLAQIAEGSSDLSGGPTDKSGALQKSGSLPGLIANAAGSESAELIDAIGQFLPGSLTGGNLKTLKEGWSVIGSSKNAGEAAQNVLNTADAALDTKGLVEAGLNQLNQDEEKHTTQNP